MPADREKGYGQARREQGMLDSFPQAKQYYSDALSVYETPVYFPGQWGFH